MFTRTVSHIHQNVVGSILVALHSYAEMHDGEAFTRIDVVFSPTDAVQPDVIYLAADRLSLIIEHDSRGAPTLVVEDMEPASSDLDPGRKRETYARYGVPEYWIVDPKKRVVVAHANPIGRSLHPRRNKRKGSITALTLPDLRFHCGQSQLAVT